MDIEKLIEGLKKTCWGVSAHVVDDERRKSATALSTLQAENKKLRAELEHWKNAHHQAALNFRQENRECNKVLAELEQVKAALRREQDG